MEYVKVTEATIEDPEIGSVDNAGNETDAGGIVRITNDPGKLLTQIMELEEKADSLEEGLKRKAALLQKTKDRLTLLQAKANELGENKAEAAASIIEKEMEKINKLKERFGL